MFSSDMKRLSLILAVALTLGTGSMNVRAHGCGGWGGWHGGCGWGGCGWWPLATFGIGLGVGTAVGYASAPRYPAYSYSYVYPAYAYAPPSSAYVVPVGSYARQPVNTPVVAPAPQVAVWVPSTPGAGKWVPDRNPYSYTPSDGSVSIASGFVTAPTLASTTTR